MSEQSDENKRTKRLSKRSEAKKEPSKAIQQSDDESSEDETEIYEKLTTKHSEKKLNLQFRASEKDKMMYLPGDFCIP